jgi:hypothetical protein
MLPIAALVSKWRKWPGEDSGPPQDFDPEVIADKAGFKPAPGGTLVPGDLPLHPVAVPDGLRPPLLRSRGQQRPWSPFGALSRAWAA